MELSFEFGTFKSHLERRYTVAPDGRTHVIDGDTIVIGGERWRLDGIDAPPIFGHSSSQPHCALEGLIGAMAKQFLEGQIVEAAQHRRLRVEILRTREKYGRQMVILFNGPTSINSALVESRLAVRWKGRGPKHRFCGCSSDG